MAKGTCSIEGCGRPAWARGWCGTHYQCWRRRGSPLPGRLFPNKAASCSVGDCERLPSVRGLCHAHYGRWKRYGDPLGGKRPLQNPEERMEWLRQAATNPGADCITSWPYGRNGKGYPMAQGRLAHHFMMEITGRPRLDPTHETRHLCGNGHLGCPNPLHLEWGTATQNMADKRAHRAARSAASEAV